MLFWLIALKKRELTRMIQNLLEGRARPNTFPATFGGSQCQWRQLDSKQFGLSFRSLKTEAIMIDVSKSQVEIAFGLFIQGNTVH